MKKEPKIIITSVEPGSIAEEAGIEPGDILISISGRNIKDIFDYRFLIAEEEITVCIRKKDGEEWEIDIEKDQYEDLGMDFEDSLMDSSKGCTNKCIFCFIDQLPKNMRETLYFKDDDSRLSYLSGNYVTLTNMKEDDLDRIVRYRMSPLNISVHTTNPELRKFMLGNRFGGALMKGLKKLVEGEIAINTQIVVCRDINDGAELDRTISDLTALYPGMQSISVVPVGLTKWRQGLHQLKPFDRESAAELIRQVEEWQNRLLEQKGSRIAFIADEFYIKAEMELPELEAYEDFPQLENGVGLVVLFQNEFSDGLKNIKKGFSLKEARHVSIATGVSVYGYIKEMADELERKYINLKIDVYPIKNDFFGENVTVTGLLTGQDIYSQLNKASLGQELLLGRSMLRSGEEVFLDDYTVTKLSENLNVKVTVVENNGKDFIDKILGI